MLDEASSSPEFADAAEGPAANAAITAIKAMIPDPRFRDFLFAISTSLSRNAPLRAPQLPFRAHFVIRAAPMRPPSEGVSGAFHSFGG